MSLQIWLPLTNDINNYGLDGTAITNKPNIVLSDGGKLGKCHKLGGYFTREYDILKTSKFSVAYWIKYTTLPQYNMYCFAINGASATDRIILLGAVGSGSTTESNRTATFAVNTVSTGINVERNVWYHYTYTYDGANGALYINGELVKSYPNIEIADRSVRILTINGRNGQRPIMTDTYMNDFRLYDHCLSAKEVQEIAKGLLLHYKMTSPDAEFDSGPVVLNSYVYSTFNTSSSNGGWLHWGQSGSAGSMGQSTDLFNYQYRSTNSQYVHWVANTADATGDYLLYQAPAFEGGFRSLQCICKEENGLPMANDICYATWNARTSQSVPNNAWTSIEPLGHGFYLCKCEGIHQDGSNNLVGIYIKPGYKVYFSEVYLEDNRKVCSDILATTPNIITGLTKGGQTTVSNYETIVTSGTNADTYFTINIPENVKYGEKYTISCQVSGLDSGGYWTFPLGGQSNTSLAWRLVNGYNQMTFTINDFSWGSKRIFMDDNGATDRTKVMTISKLSVVKHYLSDVTIEFDCSGYQYNGTKNGPITADKTSPRFESALNFKSTSYIEIDPAPIQNGMTEFTIAWWMKINTLTNNACIYNGRTTVDGPIAIFSIGGILRFDDGARHNNLYTLPKSTWEHYAITWTTSKIKVYVNGELIKEINSNTFTTAGTKATIGASSTNSTTGSGNTLDGSLSDFRIYATALTDEDVKDLYHTAVAIDNGGTIHSFEFKE